MQQVVAHILGKFESNGRHYCNGRIGMTREVLNSDLNFYSWDLYFFHFGFQCLKS